MKNKLSHALVYRKNYTYHRIKNLIYRTHQTGNKFSRIFQSVNFSIF